MPLDRDEALRAIRAAGVVGAGGAGFPTYKKLESRVDHIIANGAECEPLMYKDREVMLQRPEELLRGLAVQRELTGAERVTLAVKRKNADVLEPLRPAAEREGVELFVMEDVYPAGDEYVLVNDITGRRMRPGGIPLQVGVLVDNVETIVNVARAVEGRPVTSKFLTVAGAVREPLTAEVPVGTPIRDCLDLAGGCTLSDPVVLTGGVMMGGLETDLSLPVTKTTAGLVALPADHPLVQRKGAPQREYDRIGHSCCDQCMLCTELCPRYILGYPIEPHRVMRSLLMTGEERDRISLWAEFCCECNVCTLFACPEKLDPKNICTDAKHRLKQQGLRRSPEELERLFAPVHGMRKGRQIPIAMLYQRLGLRPYDHPAPFVPATPRPAQVTLALNSHVGVPATPTVQPGAAVRRGEPVATVAADQLGCPVHASVDGTVSEVNPRGVVIRASA
ncbi:MAG TPA: 4Fe-4S dicluster domain-containing protein [Candidatus Saccharimonadales bacterium]|nr:4Fe-4S dicluster domain-containing protein [Candidatus Saccharimonadales bacterium]